MPLAPTARLNRPEVGGQGRATRHAVRHRTHPESPCLVISITVSDSEVRRESVNSTQRACCMSDNIGNSDARLEKLLKRIMQEKDTVKYDELCSELWLVLDERESLTGVENRIGGASKTAA